MIGFIYLVGLTEDLRYNSLCLSVYLFLVLNPKKQTNAALYNRIYLFSWSNRETNL